jgi:SAM-dependent methyltransferase
MPNFKQRSYQAELMDDLDLSSEDLRRNLDELEVINYWLGGNQVVTNALDFLLRGQKISKNKVLKIADLGSGGGDLLRVIAKWAKKRKLNVELIGIDANAFMIEYAQKKASQYTEIQFIQKDIFADDFDLREYDLVICSLFCHHFTDEQLIDLFQKMHREARTGFIINDLHRHSFAYWSIWFLTRLFRGSYLVKNDAPLSVARAFRKNELKSLIQKSNIPQSCVRIRWLWAFRWQVISVNDFFMSPARS